MANSQKWLGEGAKGLLSQGREKRFAPVQNGREGANREKLTVQKIINDEMFFSLFMSLINREKLCVNRVKIGTKNPPFLHRYHFSPFTSS